MTPEQAREILKEVRANTEILEQCAGHEFEQMEGAQFAKFQCKHCRGKIDGHAVFWYRRGLEHGSKK